jgi:hypothetical protein
MLAALVAAVVAAVVVLALLLTSGGGSKRSVILFAPRFAAAESLVTNEYATYNASAAAAVRSPQWIVTSGSLFARDGNGWSGVPDTGSPDARSSASTGSSVFRLVTRRTDFGDVSIRMRFRIDRLVGTGADTHAWDGLHVFARYQSETHLYVVSVSRRDGAIVAKKKVPGGPSNGGTYYQLGRSARIHPALGVWHQVRLDVRNSGGGVRLVLQLDGKQALDVTDDGDGGPPITEAGRVGLRADNSEFDFGTFTVRSD